MKRWVLAVTALFGLGVAAPLFAAQPAAPGTANQHSPGEKKISAIRPAKKCLNDLRVFDTQMEKDGYWLAGSGYGFGYPINGYGSGDRHPIVDGRPEGATAHYLNARPGYEVRILMTSANILARHGEQQPCENVLATTRNIYKLYVTDLHNGGVRMVDVPGWQRGQIAAAQPVTSKNTSYPSHELLGTDVRDPQNQPLGSADDLVMNPKTGKIAYLMIARGGIFGIDEKYVPVPWDDFKITPNSTLLVLDTTKAHVEGAPQVSKDQFNTPGQFDKESQKVDAYWKAHISDTGTTGPKN